MQPQRVLLIHNYYQYSGGEDVVFETERKLLLAHGHQVMEYIDRNSRLLGMSRCSAAINTLWSNRSYRRIREVINTNHPDIVHFHNTFLMISPSAYYACRAEGIPVVQTLHNFRLLCPSATFFRESHICVECLGKFLAFPGIRHSCYHNSRLQTAVVASMVSLHRILRTWDNLIDLYVALTDFSRDMFIKGGLPSAKIMVKPNFVLSDPGFGNRNKDYALFVGRLSNEKGIQIMLDAWKILSPSIPLKIVGNGPLRNEILNFIGENQQKKVEYLGEVSHEEVYTLMKAAYILVFPSDCYEGFPLVIAEAFACGLPVVAPRLGGPANIIDDEVTGIFYSHGDPNELAEKIAWAVGHPIAMAQMRQNARERYLADYSEEKAYSNILRAYQGVLDQK